MKLTKNQSGIAPVLILLIIVLLGSAGFAAYRVQQANQKARQADGKESIDKQSKTESKKEDLKTQELKLADNKVSFAIPNKWTFLKGPDKCRGNATSEIKCIEGATLHPDEKLPTRYGDGTEYFFIYASVFENPNQSSAKKWLQEDFTEGSPFDNDKTSEESINGYSTYYWEKSYDGDGTSIKEFYYVFVMGNKSVLLYARTYEPGQLSDGRKVGDFRKFEPQITEIAKSIKIQ